MLDLGADVGAVILYTDSDLHGAEVEIGPAGRGAPRAHKQVHERLLAGRPLFAAVFDRLPAGDYEFWVGGVAHEWRVAVEGGTVTELDWRNRSPRTWRQ